jgi:hypothetical protein
LAFLNHKETKKQRNKGTKEQRNKGTKEQRNKGTKGFHKGVFPLCLCISKTAKPKAKSTLANFVPLCFKNR